MSSSLTVHEAATSTGWSARMLRYVEQLGLVSAPRSPSGYRLYGPAQLQRLRSLRDLLDRSGASLSDVAFAVRLRREPALAAELGAWLDADPAVTPVADPGTARPDLMYPDDDWLAFEQVKHQQLLTSPRSEST